MDKLTGQVIARLENVEIACTTCVLCWRSDYGYSNWTTEGTHLSCLAGLNKDLDGKEDGFWREGDMKILGPILDRALTCPEYRHGAPAHTDVDQEGLQRRGPNDPYTPQDMIDAGFTDDQQAAELLAKDYNG